MWNDRRLARRAARGDRDAFAAIFQRYQQDLYRYCVAILGDEQDAQDALQNTMVKALGALPGERRQIELRPWLYRVAHNEAVELRRRARPAAPLADELPAPAAGPEQRAADRGRLRDLLADIAELPERHRGALVMRELAGLDFAEIAAALGTSTGAARQVLYEARRSLQQMADGREMNCDAVTAILSEQDGRVTRRRDIRAHLGDCPDCRRFADGIRRRTETLAGIAPLPAIAAAAIAKGALGGTASGGASTVGSGAAAGGASTAGSTGGTGLAAGTVAKVASTGAMVKSAAAIVAVIGVGAVAVDHVRPFHGDGSPAGADHGPTVAGAGHAGPRGAEGVGHAGAEPVSGNFFEPASVMKVGLKPPARPKPTTVEPVTKSDAGTNANVSPAANANANGANAGGSVGNGAAEFHPAHPGHPQHPGHPAHPQHPAHGTQPGHPDHQRHPIHADLTAHVPHPTHSSRPVDSHRSSHPPHPASPQPPATAETPSAGRGSAPVTHPEHTRPSPATKATAPLETTVAAEPEAAEAAHPGKEVAEEKRP